MGKLTLVATCIWKAEMHGDLHLTHLFHATLQHLPHPLLKTFQKLPPSFSNSHTSSTKRKQSEEMKLRISRRSTGWLGFTSTVQSEFCQNNNILLLPHWPQGLQIGLDPPYSLHLLVCIRSLQPLKSRCKNFSLPMPSDLHMFRFMIAFPLCFRMGKAHIGGRHAPNVRPDAVPDILKLQGWTHLP